MASTLTASSNHLQLRCASQRRSTPSVRPAGVLPSRARVVVVRAGDLETRKEVLHSFYHDLSKEKLASCMIDDFRMSEDGGSKVYSKQEYLAVLCDCVLPAVPDFRWGAATNGETDKDGYAIVTVSATGHHTGAPLQLPGLEPVPASGKHFCLAEEVQKVKVQGDKIQEIVVLPTKGAGPRALYVALGGKLPERVAS